MWTGTISRSGIDEEGHFNSDQKEVLFYFESVQLICGNAHCRKRNYSLQLNMSNKILLGLQRNSKNSKIIKKLAHPKEELAKLPIIITSS